MRKYFGFLLTGILLCTNVLHAQKTLRVRKLVDSKHDKLYGLPLSVVDIPAGNIVISGNAADTSSAGYNQQHLVKISSFYISTTEVTNAQYKEFTDWVRDSIAAFDLGGKYIIVKNGDTAINWKYAADINYSDPAIMEKLTDLLLDPSKSLSNHPQIDPHKLIYRMQGFNYQEAAKKENEGRNPKDFLYKQDIEVYPDTLVWMRDFGYANNEHMSIGYYASDKYKNYPVVGVSWLQANAYCDWFTKQRIYREQRRRKMPADGVCRLPTQAEWAYAASLNDDNSDVKANRRNKVGKDKKQEEGLQGNKLFPEMVIRNKEGGYHIYGMAGNVSEWTNTSFYEGGINFVNRFNPDIEWGSTDSKSKFKRRKVVCGGSWKDIPQLTTTSNRFYEDMDNAHSYIGFRVVLNFPD